MMQLESRSSTVSNPASRMICSKSSKQNHRSAEEEGLKVEGQAGGGLDLCEQDGLRGGLVEERSLKG